MSKYKYLTLYIVLFCVGNIKLYNNSGKVKQCFVAFQHEKAFLLTQSFSV